MAIPVADSVALTGDPRVDGLIQGSRWVLGPDNLITFSFHDSEFQAWDSTLRAAFFSGLTTWSDVAEIGFQEVLIGGTVEDSTADMAITFADGALQPDALGIGVFPDPDFADIFLAELDATSSEPINRTTYPNPEGDIAFENFSGLFATLLPGSAAFEVALHEIGHALGLKHTDDDGANGRPTFSELGLAAFESAEFTIMTSTLDNTGSLVVGHAATPMPFDILAIQEIYGANLEHRTGDDTYILADDGALRTIWDAGGTDTVSAAGLNFGVAIDIQEGGFTRHGTFSGTAVAFRAVIENVVGSAHADTIFGNDVANDLRGGAGNDFVSASFGDDTVSGGDGVDSLVGGAGNDILQADLADIGGGRVDGGSGTDTLALEGDLALDLGNIALGRLAMIEEFDLTFGGAVSVAIAPEDIIGIGGDDQTLTVRGDGADSVTLNGDWLDVGSRLIGGTIFSVFESLGSRLNIDDSIDQSNIEQTIAGIDLFALDGNDGFVVEGEAAIGYAGRAVSDAGDINGDGFDDFIIGARGVANGSIAGAGQSYVVFGTGSDFDVSLDLSSLNGANGFSVGGIAANDLSGSALSGAGDVNGDGFDDLIIGSFNASPSGRAYAGQSHVVFGKAGGFAADLDLSTLNGANGFTINGVDSRDYAGYAVSGAGDFNGDGFADLIIGADYGSPNGQNRAGESYIVFGAAGFSASLELSNLDGTNGFVLNGIDASDQSGFAVAEAGDVNGDGFDDVLIGAFAADPGNRNAAGESYLVFGGDIGFGASFNLAQIDGNNGIVVNGIDANDFSGSAVSSAGDINGDGINDLIFGSYGADGGGEAHVISGLALQSGGPLDLSTLDGFFGFTLSGIGQLDQAGFSVSGAGDVNGDGLDDLLVGANLADPNGTNAAGEAYVVFGRFFGFPDVLELSTLDGTTGLILRGTDENDQTGYSVSAAGDINGDGFADVIVGAPFADAGGLAQAGKGYILFGRDFVPVPAIAGGDTDDSLFGGSAGDTMIGDLGDDTLVGNDGDDLLRGGNGDDSLVGGGDFDAILGQQGDDIISGGVGNDRLDGDDGADSISGGIEDDVISGGEGADTLSGDGGTDFLFGEAGDDSLAGGEGFDQLVGGAGNDNIRGGGGSDVLFGSAGADTILGGLGADSLVGGSGNDRLLGREGDDILFGESGADVLFGDDGNDSLVGDSGNDQLFGAIGADFLFGGDGADRLKGDDGDDFLSGEAGTDILEGGFGNDHLQIDNSDLTNGLVTGGAGFDIALFIESQEIDLANFAGTRLLAVERLDFLTGADIALDLASQDIQALGGDGFILEILGDAGDTVNGSGTWTDIGEFNRNSVSFRGLVDGNGVLLVSGDMDLSGTTIIAPEIAFDLASLDGSNGFTFEGQANFDLVGGQVANAGDLNNDGLDDIVIGAPGAPDGQSTGEAYVIFGTSEGFGAVIDVSGIDGSNGFLITAAENFSFTGGSVDGAGDVNGDGIDDLVIGARGSDAASQTDAGTAHVIFGSNSGFGAQFALSALDGNNGFTIPGNQASGYLGRSVSVVGDINGDGLDDLIVSAPYNAAGDRILAGQVFAVFGTTGGFDATLDLCELDGDNGFVLNGIEEFDYAGTRTSGAGDINGDGVDDLIVSAPFADPNSSDRAGQTYVLFGDPDGFSASVELSALDGANGFAVNGISGGDFSGFETNAAGDFNGDGFADFVIGAFGADVDGREQAGQSYVVFGKDAPFSASLNAADLAVGQGFAINGIAAFDGSGRAVSGVGDVNGDGLDDLVVTAPYTRPTSPENTGQAYLIFGTGEVVQSIDLSTLDGINGIFLEGGLANGYLGSSVDTAGDIDGDGFDDLIIGSDRAIIGGGPTAGRAQVVFGREFVPTGGVIGTDTGERLVGRFGITELTGGDTLTGSLGDDTLIGNFGDDLLRGGSDADSLFGADGNDTLLGHGDGDFADGGRGSDRLIGDTGDDSLLGGEGADQLLGEDGDDSLRGGAGNDTIQAGDGADTVLADSEDDVVFGGGGADRLFGRDGDDTVRGGADGDVIFGDSGADLLFGNNGSDQIFASTGNDTLDGGGDDDRLKGDDGDDVLTGGLGIDIIEGGDGNDSLIADSQDFIGGLVTGGDGADTVGLTEALDLSTVSGARLVGIEAIDLSLGSDVALALAPDDIPALGGALKSLRIFGDFGDSVSASGLWFDIGVEQIGHTLFQTYVSEGSTLLVSDQIDQSGIAVGLPVPFIAVSALDGNNGFAIDGAIADGDSGDAVSNAGDINGDGFDDLLIGAKDAAIGDTDYAGQSYVVFGAAGGFSAALDLSALDGGNGFSLTGTALYDYAGESVSGLGDINGDGIDDLIIGAGESLGDPLGLNPLGQSFVVFGSRQGFSGDIELSALDGANGFALIGIDGSDEAGKAVSGIDDFNGDGLNDLLIGAAGGDPNGENDAGESYVVFGSASGFPSTVNLSELNGADGFVINGVESVDFSGRAVSGAGDLNGDGFADLMIGAQNADVGEGVGAREDAGETYIVFGTDRNFGTALDLSRLDGLNGFTFAGADTQDASGTAIANAGDVNGDGFDDIVIGAPFASYGNQNSAGEAYVIFGTPFGFPAASSPGDLFGGNGFVIRASTQFDFFGRSVSGAGDVNGDGVDDLIIGAYGYGSGGGAFVVFGRPDGLGASLTIDDLDGRNGFAITAAYGGDRLGDAVSAAGDVNGDGFDDLLIGAPGAAPGGLSRSGQSYVIFGRDFDPAPSVIGSDAGDLLVGQAGLFGGDTLIGGLGDDTLIGNTGNDLSRGGNDADSITGAAGDDTLLGNRGDDTITGDAGQDRVVAGDGDDSLSGGSGDDSLFGDQGQDTLLGGTENDRLFGGGGGDQLFGDTGDDTIEAGAGNDNIRGGAGNDQIQGAAGDDTVLGDTGDDLIEGGAGNDRLLGRDGFDVVGGGDGDDVLFGDTGDDVLFGDDGADQLFAADGNDQVFGGEGADRLKGDAGDDTLRGSEGSDILEGGTGNDFLFFDEDDLGNGLIIGGDGSDTAVVGGELSLVQLRGTAGSRMIGIELIDLSGANDVTLTLAPEDIVALGGANVTLQVVGGEGDTVNTTGLWVKQGFSFIDDLPAATYVSGQATLVVSNDIDQSSIFVREEIIDLGGIDGNNGFSVDGADFLDLSGISVSAAGDVNGDGFADIIIGAYGADPAAPEAGESYVVFGTAVGFSSNLNVTALDGNNGFTLDGSLPGENSGRAVSAIGDVNADGFADILVGAPTEDAGRTTVVFGRASGFDARIDLASVDGSDGFNLFGVSTADQAGYAVGGGGDINGDGVDDLIIGAPQADPNETKQSGQSYVVFGDRLGDFSGSINLSALDGLNGFALNGTNFNEQSGASVAIAGDVNGDGFDDILVGAPARNSGSQIYAGEVSVVFGTGSFAAASDLSAIDGTNGFVLGGIGPADYTGRAVSGAGDINGDGLADVIVGAPFADAGGNQQSGRSYVVFGSENPPARLALSALDGVNGFILDGIAAGDQSGVSVSAAGDVNGDSFDDLIIGAHFAESDDTGESYVLFGKAAGFDANIDLSQLDGLNGFRIAGAASDDFSGRSVDGAGDVNGDGFDDLIISSHSATPAAGREYAGRTTILFGRDFNRDSTSKATDSSGLLPPTDTDEVFTGSTAADFIAGAGGADLIRGGNEDDTVAGDDGADTLLGNQGADRLDGGGGADRLTGGIGDDTVQGGLANDDVMGDAGADLLSGEGGDDTLLGGRDNDELLGGLGADSLRGDGGDDTLVGADGADILRGSAGIDDLQGGAGNDLLLGEDGLDFLSGGDDNDTLIGGGSGDSLSGQGGDDLIFSDSFDTVSGGDGNDTLSGGGGLVSGDAGDDSIVGTGAFDVLDGGVDSDTLFAGGDNDVLIGGSGNDFLFGDDGDDQAFGDAGNDDLRGGAGNDFLAGGDDADTVFGDLGNDTVSGEAGGDRLFGRGGDDLVDGGAGADVLFGDDGDDVLEGAGGVDQLFGATGNDLVFGGAENDRLKGDAGEDSLLGEAGADIMEGGAGNDVLFADGDDLTSGLVDGGAGTDVVVVIGDLLIDLSVVGGRLAGIETLSLFSGAVSVSLAPEDVLALGGTDATLRIEGFGDDTVTAAGIWVREGSQVIDNVAIEVYTSGGATLEVSEFVDQTGIPSVTPAISLSELDGVNGFVLNGPVAFAQSGSAVSGAGDINGDGFDDLLIGAGNAGTSALGRFRNGEAHVLFGGTGGFEATIELSTLDGADGFTMAGAASTDGAGFAVSGTGDINGDGRADLIIGAPSASPGGNSNNGTVHIVFGADTGFSADFDLASLDGSNGFTFAGTRAGGRVGNAVGSGDFNGDGIADLILGAPAVDFDGAIALGETYVVFGTNQGFASILELSDLDGANGFVLRGVDSGGYAGTAVANAGDVNGDGIDDLIIGAHSANGVAGEGYVVFGSADGFDTVFELAALDGANGFAVPGANISDFTGFAVGGAGDVNGDGLDDLIIGAPFAASGSSVRSGQSFVIFGTSNGFGASLPVNTLDGQNGFTLNGINAVDDAGLSVSGAGDVNADGFDDILIGAPQNRGVDGTGQAYLVFGSAGGFAPDFELSALDGRNGILLDGFETLAAVGVSVSGGGDIDGDGFDDLIIGAQNATANGYEIAGQSFVLFGRDFGPRVGAVGGDDSDLFNGTDDADTIAGAVGDDSLNGADGDDLLRGGNGFDLLSGDDGSDTLLGDGGNDTLDGGAGSDRALGEAGDDLIDGGLGNDDLAGGAGNDTLLGEGGNDGLRGGAGDDNLNGGSGMDTLAGGTGADDLRGGGDADLIDGGTGADTVLGDFGDDVITGGAGNDRLLGRHDDDRINGDAGDDVLFGDTGADTVSGDAGNDQLFGSDDRDLLLGGAGNDRLKGDAGDDLIVGDSGDDVLEGGAGNDSGRGSEGDDAVFGDDGADTLFGDGGNDTVDGGIGTDRLFGSGGDDRLDGGGDADVMFGDDGDDTMLGGTGNDLLFGSIGNDVVAGGIGVDRLKGDDGNDRISGDAGADILEGGAGDDTLVGDDDDLVAGLVIGDTGFDLATFSDSATIDLGAVAGVRLTGIEAIDVSGGSGSVIDLVSADITALGGDGQSLRILGDADDTVAAGGLWLDIGRQEIDSITFNRYTDNSNNLLLIETDVSQGGITAITGAIALSDLVGSNGFALDGTNSLDSSGGAVAGVGDINGDGFADVLVGAANAGPGGVLGAGETALIFGTGTAFPSALALSALDGNNGFTITGFEEFGASGVSVSGIGDFNNDGLDDIVIGADGSDAGGQENAGRSFVLFGDAGGFGTVVSLTSLDGTNGFVLNGIDAFDSSGRAVSGAGDVNGDGIADLIIGAEQADAASGGVGAGESYLLFGTETGFSASIALSGLDGQNGFVIDGAAQEHASGASVSGAGDVNGDGFDDLIIGAPDAGPGGRLNAGQAFVLFGAATGFRSAVSLSALDGVNGFALNGSAENESVGHAVSGAGDINGDGLADMIVAGTGDMVYVVFGADGGFPAALELSALDGDDGFVILATEAFAGLGSSVSGAGDVNGDGIDDLIVGEPGTGSDRGASHILLGTTAGFGLSFDLSTLDGANGFTLTGGANGDASGTAVSGAGDVNGDGFDDLIVGAPSADTLLDSAGRSFVVFGRESVLRPIIDGTDNDDVLAGDTDAGAINGGPGDDILDGAAGDDVLRGALGNDRLLGGDGRDTLLGDRGDDVLDAGAGDDRAVGDAGDDTANGDLGDDRLIGGGGADTLSGENGNDTLEGGGGDDRLLGGNGLDLVAAGAGDDFIFGGNDPDVLSGDAGADTVLGDLGNDTVIGGAGNDRLLGRGGDDRIDGGLDDDQIFGDAGADTLLGAAGNDQLFGSTEDDQMAGGAGDDRLKGDDGADQLDGGDGADLLEGGLGTDSIVGGAGADSIFAGNDNDTIAGDSGNDTIFGDLGDDFVDGGGDADRLFGRSGDDTVRGGSEDDVIFGDGGADSLLGDGGVDLIFGSVGDDLISGGDDDDRLVGDVGDDILNGDDGLDLIEGGDGNDTMRGGAGNDFVLGGSGADSVFGDIGDDTITGGAGIDRLLGRDGNDSVVGGDDVDVIFGDDGDDTLAGDGGNDQLFGSIGNDRMFGGLGADRLKGDAGADFLFGDSGADILEGGDGDDDLRGGDDDDFVLGDGGADTVFGDLGNDTVDGGAGADRLLGRSGDDHVSGGSEDDVIFGDGGADTLLGDSGADQLFGSIGNDFMFGGLGDDRLKGDAGEDELFGDDGRDLLEGGDGDDSLRGGSGNDTVLGGAGADTVFGDLDDDVINGGAGIDRLFGRDGNDSVSGGDDGDLIFGDGGNDTLAGDGGNDQLFGFTGNDRIFGGLGIDRLKGDAGSDVLFGDAGDDILEGGDGDDDLRGGADNDLILGDGGADTIFGDQGSDTVIGGAGADRLLGREGDDSISGGDDGDVIFGDAGADTLQGDAGNDQLFGSTENDRLFGGLGDDRLKGDAGDDILFGDAGVDVLEGGADNDSLRGGADNDVLLGDAGADTILGDGGNDTVDGGVGADRLFGRDGDDRISGGADNDVLFADGGADTVFGDGGIDQIFGAAGNDSLLGGDGADRLKGDDGDDILSGDAGGDVLEGGTGNDLLIVDSADLTSGLLDGGAGNDFMLVTDETALDLSALAGNRLVGIEGLDITGSGLDATVSLAPADIASLGAENETLLILGDAGDTVTASGLWTNDGSQIIDAVSYTVYSSGSASLLVADGVDQTGIPT